MKRMGLLSLFAVLALLMAACAPASPVPNTGFIGTQPATMQPTQPVGAMPTSAPGLVVTATPSGQTGPLPQETPVSGIPLNEPTGAVPVTPPGVVITVVPTGQTGPLPQETPVSGIPLNQPTGAVQTTATVPLPTSATSVPATGSTTGLALGSLINLQLKDANGGDLGTVQNVIVGSDAQSAYLVVDRFGQTVLVPWQALQVTTVNGQTSLSLIKGLDFFNAPPTDLNTINTSQPNWDQQVRDYWTNQFKDAGISPTYGALGGIVNPVLSSGLLNSIVTGQGISNLGSLATIKNVVINPHTGQVEYFLLDVSPLTNGQTMLIQIPANIVQISQQGSNLVVSLNTTALANLQTTEGQLLQGLIQLNEQLMVTPTP